MQANGVWRYKALPFSTQEYGTDRQAHGYGGESRPDAGGATDAAGLVDFGMVAPAQEWFGTATQEAKFAPQVRGCCRRRLCLARWGGTKPWLCSDCEALAPTLSPARTSCASSILSSAQIARLRVRPSHRDATLLFPYRHDCLMTARSCFRRNQLRLASSYIFQGLHR